MTSSKAAANLPDTFEDPTDHVAQHGTLPAQDAIMRCIVLVAH
jgi:hypothetical protein